MRCIPSCVSHLHFNPTSSDDFILFLQLVQSKFQHCGRFCGQDKLRGQLQGWKWKATVSCGARELVWLKKIKYCLWISGFSSFDRYKADFRRKLQDQWFYISLVLIANVQNTFPNDGFNPAVVAKSCSLGCRLSGGTFHLSNTFASQTCFIKF